LYGNIYQITSATLHELNEGGLDFPGVPGIFSPNRDKDDDHDISDDESPVMIFGVPITKKKPGLLTSLKKQ